MVKYSARSAKALGFLKQIVNDVEVFVEDTGNPNMWVRIIKSILPDDVKIKSVNLMGGKANVLAACRLDQEADGRKKIYIIDGDLDLLQGRRKPRLKHLYRLKAYCIENLLISESSLILIGCESAPKMTEAKVKAAVNFADIEEDVRRMLGALFVVYAAANRLCPEIPTVSYPVHRLIRRVNNQSELDRELVVARIREVVKAVLGEMEMREYIGCRKKISKRAAAGRAMNTVSGKDYILPILYRTMKDKVGYRGTAEQFKVRLANEFSPAREPSFARAILGL